MLFIVSVLLSTQGLMPLECRASDIRSGPMEPQSSPEQYPVWSDPLDDLSHVYVPTTGLAGVEVVGGEAHLKSGRTDGWFASSVISCPKGHLYDFILIEAELPGDSYVEISLLNASGESTVVGFANETIPGFIKVRSIELSIRDVDPLRYPHVRVQLDLHADGINRPRILSWALYFIGEDVWMDDFKSRGKMDVSRGIDLADGQLALNHSHKSSSSSSKDYPKFPTIAQLPVYRTTVMYAYYANSARTGYEEGSYTATNYTYRMAFDDLNSDGYLDLLFANYGTTGNYPEVWWGSASGSLSPSACKKFAIPEGYGIDTGDVNGDGWTDVVIAAHSSGTGSAVFFGDGSGQFNSFPDVQLPQYLYVRTGDVNGDGYDDLVFWSGGTYYKTKVHMGGPLGPSSTADLTIDSGIFFYMVVQDINADGFADVICARQHDEWVFLGSPSGLDATVDYVLGTTNDGARSCGAGDINGDGWLDLVFLSIDVINIFEGTESGWDNASRRTFDVGLTTWALLVADVDRDGFDDVIIQAEGVLDVYKGSPSWSMDRIVRRPSTSSAYDMAIAVPKGSMAKGYSGHFVTEEISIPAAKKWDVLDLSARMETNTTLRITLLDASRAPISGFDNLTAMSLDLSRLTQSSIRVRVDLTSELNTTSPWLERLTVTWIDRMSWMDRFFGTTRVDRLLGMTVGEGALGHSSQTSYGPSLLFASLRNDLGGASPSLGFTDSGALNYNDCPPIELEASHAHAIDCADVDGDGLADLALANYREGGSYSTTSPIYRATPMGWRDAPEWTFDTIGAHDVLLRDLNRDGNIDVVFAQETDGTTYSHPSVLFWGSASGFNSTADVTLATTGATAVEAADLDADGWLDLVFACGRAASSSCDSMVFLQRATGFDGTTPDHLLPTQSADAVAVGDLDGDGALDIVFANNFSTGMTEIDSFIYWGLSGGGFESSPRGVRTAGASDVKVADLDGDSDLDLVFANSIDNEGSYELDSYVYLNAGGRAFQSLPDIRLPTTGACAVAVADLDGTGWKDIVFACQRNATSYSQSSMVYLGDDAGYHPLADIRLPTVGASDIMAVPLITGTAAYLSEVISPENPTDVGGFDTLSYQAVKEPSHNASVMLLDATSWEVLAGERIQAGTCAWKVAGMFRFKEHVSVRVAIVASGLDAPGDLSIDDLRLNWTKRDRTPPYVLGIDANETRVLRGRQVTLFVNATDEYDLASELRVRLEYRTSGGPWTTFLLGTPSFEHGLWKMAFGPRLDSEVGPYDFRASAVDTDGMSSSPVELPSLILVLNNLPTAPGVRILPSLAFSDSVLIAEMTDSSSDLESTQLTYHFHWYRDGVPMETLTTDRVSPSLTSRGENWSVEVRAYDGIDEGPAGVAWSVILNSAPRTNDPLPPLDLEEDASDTTTLGLASAFIDADGDPISWRLATPPAHLRVDIDASTGAVGVFPEADWSGVEELVFVGSDGELEARQTVPVTVMAVNDPPQFSAINGQPITVIPVRLAAREDENLTVRLEAVDIEGSELRFSCNLSWLDIDGRTGLIVLTPTNDDVGTIHLAVTVRELANPDVASTIEIVIDIVNVNDPMDTPRILSPATGMVYRENQTIILQGSCTDPDVLNGQELNFTWSSDISGVLGYGPHVTLNGLAPGGHTITLMVHDSEYSRSASIYIDVRPLDDQPIDGPEDGGFLGMGVGLLLLLVVVLVVAIVVARTRSVAARRAREEHGRQGAPDVTERTTGESAVKEPAKIAQKTDVGPEGPALESVHPEAMEWRQVNAPTESAVRYDPTRPHPSQPLAPQSASPPPAPQGPTTGPQQAPASSTITPEPGGMRMDAEEVARAREEREVMTALTQLPQGLPTSLWGWDMSALAREVLSGRRRTLLDGTELVLVGGRWYNADRRNVGRFMRESIETEMPVRPSRSAEDTMDRLDLLERALLEGKISEETYRELKRKYEG